MKSFVLNSTFLVGSIAVAMNCACTKNGSSEASPQKPAFQALAVSSKIGGQNFRSGSSSFAITADNKFEMLFDTDVRYFPEFEATSTGEKQQEQDDRCILKLSGTVSYFDPTQRAMAPVRAGMKLSVEHTDVVATTPSKVCTRFSKALTDTKDFEQWLFDFDSNFISLINGFDFGVYAKVNGREGWLFNSSLHNDRKYLNTYDARIDNFQYTYFVKPGDKIDLTQKTLADLNGMYNDRQASALQVNGALKNIILANSKCGTLYRIDVASVYHDGDSFKMKVNPVEIPAAEQPGSAPTDSSCVDFKADIASMKDTDVRLYFMIIPGHGNRSYLTLTFTNAQARERTYEFVTN